jgi:type IV pilus assembly protein PilE
MSRYVHDITRRPAIRPRKTTSHQLTIALRHHLDMLSICKRACRNGFRRGEVQDMNKNAYIRISPSFERSAGFTLMELMVAVAIVGILAAIAYPSYTRQIAKGNRSAAQSFMFSLANKQEQYLLDNRQITTTVTDLLTPSTDVTKNYTVTITAGATPLSYTITATPTATQASRDAQCGTLSLKNDGTKGITGTGTVATCW